MKREFIVKIASAGIVILAMAALVIVGYAGGAQSIVKTAQHEYCHGSSGFFP